VVSARAWVAMKKNRDRRAKDRMIERGMDEVLSEYL
jgi:hypothetical protein